MKIVAVIGSPRGRGSGYRVVRMIEDRMKALGEVEFAYLFLKDANLQPGRGCYTCMARGEDKCPLKDDRPVIEQDLLAADGVILSSPVHVANVSVLRTSARARFHGPWRRREPWPWAMRRKARVKRRPIRSRPRRSEPVPSAGAKAP